MTHIYKGVCILLCMLTVTGRVAGQQRAAAVRLGGSVTDEQGRPVVGANIVAYDVGRKPHGTVADAAGRFVFDCPAGASEFRVRMLGYRERVVKIVAGKSSYDVRLTESSENVADVVVTGYVDKKKESYTGATHVIRREEIEALVHTNVLNIIQLRTPGFEIFDDIANGSDPNKVPDMVLRGRSSFIEGDRTNVPLFILDGTEVDISYVFDMPSDDIESISVLKMPRRLRSTARKPPTGWWSSPRARRRPGGCKSAIPGTSRSAFPICQTTACSMRTRSSNTNGRRASTAISRGAAAAMSSGRNSITSGSHGPMPESTPTGSGWPCARDSTTSTI